MKRSTILAIAAFAVFTLASCGNDSGTASGKQGTEAAAAAQQDNHLMVESDDNMKYNVRELHAKPGKITLSLKHVGKIDRFSMGHNLVILKPGTRINDFVSKAATARDNDYIPQSEAASIIAHTRIIGGGESDTIEFNIEEKGSYDFICSFPGHSGVMKGVLIVE